MKINNDFIVHEDGDSKLLVSTGATKFSGLVRSKGSAGFIISCLENDTTEDEIVAKMLEYYDVSEEIARRDVKKIVGQLKQIGAIDE